MIKAFPLKFKVLFSADLIDDEMTIKSFLFSKSKWASMVLLVHFNDAFGYFAKLCNTFPGCIIEEA